MSGFALIWSVAWAESSGFQGLQRADAPEGEAQGSSGHVLIA